MAVIMAENKSLRVSIQKYRKEYQDLYTGLSVFQKVQLSESESDSESGNKSFFELNGKQKAAMIGGAAVALAGAIGYARGENGLARLNDLKEAVHPVELAGSADFQAAFLAALDFGETNRFKG